MKWVKDGIFNSGDAITNFLSDIFLFLLDQKFWLNVKNFLVSDRIENLENMSLSVINDESMVDGSSRRDIKEDYAHDQEHFNLPKIYVKQTYCVSCAIRVSCAIHARVVLVSSASDPPLAVPESRDNVSSDTPPRFA